MKKNIDQMSRLVQHNNISLFEGTRKTDFGSNIDDHEICHALKDGFSQSQALIDSRDSSHMVSYKEPFPFL